MRYADMGLSPAETHAVRNVVVPSLVGGDCERAAGMDVPVLALPLPGLPRGMMLLLVTDTEVMEAALNGSDVRSLVPCFRTTMDGVPFESDPFSATEPVGRSVYAFLHPLSCPFGEHWLTLVAPCFTPVTPY